MTFPFHLVFDPEWLDERDVPLLIGLLKEKTVSPFWRRCVFCVLDSIRSRLGNPVMTALKTACSEGDEAFCQAATEALKKIQGTQDEAQR